LALTFNLRPARRSVSGVMPSWDAEYNRAWCNL
jgi:hypothetical protein